MTNRTFRFSLKARDCTKKFHPDLEPGVLVFEEASWTEEQLRTPELCLFHFRQDMIDRYIEVDIEEITQ